MPPRICKNGHDTEVVGRDKWGHCRECLRVRQRINYRKHMQDPAKAEKERLRCLEKNRRRYAEDPEYGRAATRKWRANNLEKARAVGRETQRRRRATPTGKIEGALRRRMHGTLVGSPKAAKTFDAAGCTVAELRAYLESKWLPGMSWENYGLKGWHVDHVTPCSFFDLSDPEQQLKCFHYTNLQPLWAFDNISKGGTNRLPKK